MQFASIINQTIPNNPLHPKQEQKNRIASDAVFLFTYFRP